MFNFKDRVIVMNLLITILIGEKWSISVLPKAKLDSNVCSVVLWESLLGSVGSCQGRLAQV